MSIIPKSIEEMKSGVERELNQAERDNPDYTEEEILYLGALRKRLTRTKSIRDTNHDFLDGMTYIQRCESNRRGATSFIKPRKNRMETNFTTGITRSKLMVNLASLIDLNMTADITAYDQNDLAMVELGEAMENILEKSQELDGDVEKKAMRHYTLMEQGEVFVEVMWKKGFELKKNVENFVTGKFKNVGIRSRLKKVLGKLTTNVIRNEKVYLGDITQPVLGLQPHLFTAENKPYDEVEQMFKDFEMWKFVAEDRVPFSPETEDGETSLGAWTIGVKQKGFVEIVKYQSKVDNEFQILLNGIPMLPIGFPLTEISPNGDYLLEQQIFSIIDSHYAYGKSLVQLLKTAQGLEDEFWKLAILKGQQSAIPPMINNTGRILSGRVMMPGTFTSNIPFGKLKPLLEKNNGLGSGEIAVLQLLRDNIEDKSFDKKFGGQQGQRDTTATEAQLVQGQAEKLLGLTIFSASLLEKKIADKSIPILIQNWFDPVDNKVDKVKNQLVDIFRRSNIEKPIDGEGVGQQIVEVVGKTDDIPSDFDIFKEEQEITNSTGTPTRKIVLSRENIRGIAYVFRTTVVPTPRKSSNLQKLLFREEVGIYSLSPNFSMDWFEENAAITYGRNPSKVFDRKQGATPDPTVANNILPPESAGKGLLNKAGGEQK